MRRYLYCYQTTVHFSQPVTHHHVLLRCLPMPCRGVAIDEEHLVVSPGFSLRRGQDAFGNRIVYGERLDAHATLAYVSTGVVTLSPDLQEVGAMPISMYLQPSRLASWPTDEDAILPPDSLHDAESIGRWVYEQLTYAPLSTTVETSAVDVLRSGKGVCQDYAHVMVALCRRTGIAARYVCGFVAGTGVTHAWVETFDGTGWRGYDPTHGIPVEHGYLKLAHGRDAADCPVNRGVYLGNAAQQTQISVTLLQSL